jgi:two-component system OmpR family response regulator
MTASTPRRPKLLLVDDDAGVLAAMTAYFEMVGIDIVTTSSPFEVPFLIGREAPDVVLVDVGMPSLDGTKIIGSLRERIRLSTHFILFSGKSRRDLATLTEQHGATDCISKGEDMASIERRVRFWMDDTQRRSA